MKRKREYFKRHPASPKSQSNDDDESSAPSSDDDDAKPNGNDSSSDSDVPAVSHSGPDGEFSLDEAMADGAELSDDHVISNDEGSSDDDAPRRRGRKRKSKKRSGGRRKPKSKSRSEVSATPSPKKPKRKPSKPPKLKKKKKGKGLHPFFRLFDKVKKRVSKKKQMREHAKLRVVAQPSANGSSSSGDPDKAERARPRKKRKVVVSTDDAANVISDDVQGGAGDEEAEEDCVIVEQAGEEADSDTAAAKELEEDRQRRKKELMKKVLKLNSSLGVRGGDWKGLDWDAPTVHVLQDTLKKKKEDSPPPAAAAAASAVEEEDVDEGLFGKIDLLEDDDSDEGHSEASGNSPPVVLSPRRLQQLQKATEVPMTPKTQNMFSKILQWLESVPEFRPRRFDINADSDCSDLEDEVSLGPPILFLSGPCSTGKTHFVSWLSSKYHLTEVNDVNVKATFRPVMSTSQVTTVKKRRCAIVFEHVDLCELAGLSDDIPEVHPSSSGELEAGEPVDPFQMSLTAAFGFGVSRSNIGEDQSRPTIAPGVMSRLFRGVGVPVIFANKPRIAHSNRRLLERMLGQDRPIETYEFRNTHLLIKIPGFGHDLPQTELKYIFVKTAVVNRAVARILPPSLPLAFRQNERDCLCSLYVNDLRAITSQLHFLGLPVTAAKRVVSRRRRAKKKKNASYGRLRRLRRLGGDRRYPPLPMSTDGSSLTNLPAHVLGVSRLFRNLAMRGTEVHALETLLESDVERARDGNFFFLNSSSRAGADPFDFLDLASQVDSWGLEADASKNPIDGLPLTGGCGIEVDDLSPATDLSTFRGDDIGFEMARVPSSLGREKRRVENWLLYKSFVDLHRRPPSTSTSASASASTSSSSLAGMHEQLYELERPLPKFEDNVTPREPPLFGRMLNPTLRLPNSFEWTNPLFGAQQRHFARKVLRIAKRIFHLPHFYRPSGVLRWPVECLDYIWLIEQYEMVRQRVLQSKRKRRYHHEFHVQTDPDERLVMTWWRRIIAESIMKGGGGR